MTLLERLARHLCTQSGAHASPDAETLDGKVAWTLFVDEAREKMQTMSEAEIMGLWREDVG